MKVLALYVLVIGLLWLTSCGMAPFIEPNTVHKTRSELELNLIANENRYSAIIIAVYSKLQKKDEQGLENLLANVFAYEPHSGFALMVDCKNFQLDMDGKLSLCDPKEKNVEGATVIAFYPRSYVLNIKGHEIIGNHDTEVLRDPDAYIIAKKIRERLPNYVVQIEDGYDLGEFLKNTQMTKLIFFEESLLNPHYLQKLSAKYHNRVDVGICDNKNLAKKFERESPSIILLEYNYTNKQYEQFNYTGSTNFQDRPFQDIVNFIQPHVLPNRSRDLLLDFELVEQAVYNLSSTKLLQKLISQDKMTLVEVNKGFNCTNLKGIIPKYTSMLSYACLTTNQTEFADIPIGTVLLFKDSITQRTIFKPSDKIENVAKFPQLSLKISTQKQSQICIDYARANNKLVTISYYPQKSFQDYVIRYLNTLPSFTSVFQFCQVYNPDRYVIKEMSLQIGSLSVLVPMDDQKSTSKKVQNKNLDDFGGIKFFLRQFAVSKFIQLYESKIDKNISTVNTPQELTEQCFSKPCVLALINTKKKTRSQLEIKMLTELARDFETQFNVVWTDGNCHHELLSQLEIKPEQLSALVYYNEKSNRYSVEAGKYWIKKEVKKWFKWLRSGPKMKRFKYALDIEPKPCREDTEL